MKKNTHTYFYTSFAAYIFGLGLTIFIMHIFKHAQVSMAVPGVLGVLSLQVTGTYLSTCKQSSGVEQACLCFSWPFHLWSLQGDCPASGSTCTLVTRRRRKDASMPVAFIRKATPFSESSQQIFAHISWDRSVSLGPSCNVAMASQPW